MVVVVVMWRYGDGGSDVSCFGDGDVGSDTSSW